MAERIGKYTLKFGSRPGIIASAAIVGSKEGDGPLGGNFDEIITDGTFGEKTWEKAESAFQHRAVVKAIEKSGMTAADIDMLMAGDLLSQCSGSAFGARDLGIPFVGLYGACSTMALSLALAALSVDSGAARIAAAATSSHFCSAEKQFRTPLEYGGQRPPTAQWTATAAGCAVIGKSASPHIEAATFGRITDYGVKDANNMGAAMAPAACSTITAFLQDTKTQPEDLDLILTGDLGYVGSTLLRELMRKQEHIDITTCHNDCGLMLYRLNEQDVNSGGSGCGCSAAVVCSHIVSEMRSGRLNKVLFVGTGALLSAVSPLQGETVPSIAHLELADTVLYQDLRFSRFDTVFEVVSECFPEVRPEKWTGFCLKVLPPAETVFSKYPIDDRFESSPSYHTLTIELTGFIQSYIEQYGI